MKTLVISLLTATAATLFVSTASAQTRVSEFGFTSAGDFRMVVPEAARVEASHDLHAWTPVATLNQASGLEDSTARQLPNRFYRVQSANGATDVVGFVKIVIPPGHSALLANSFRTPLRMDSPEARQSLFGVPNPAVKVSLYTNSNFAPHLFNAATGSWEPPLSGIRALTGFSVQNIGTTPLTLRLSGETQMTPERLALPAGSALLVPPYPYAGPVERLLAFPVADGAQVQWFNEQRQEYRTSTFDSLSGGKWAPPLPNLALDRALIVKTPRAVTWTNSFPAPAP